MGMGSYLLRNTRKRLAQDGVFVTKTPTLATQLQQCRAYAPSRRLLSEARGFKLWRPLSATFPKRSLSSSTSSSPASNSNTGFLGWYLGKLQSRPIVTKSISTSLIYAAADITSQVNVIDPLRLKKDYCYYYYFFSISSQACKWQVGFIPFAN